LCILWEIDARDPKRRGALPPDDEAAPARPANGTGGRPSTASPLDLTPFLRPTSVAIVEASAVSGLAGYTAGELRTRDVTPRVIHHLGAWSIRVGRAAGHHVEPVMGVDPDLFIAAAEGTRRDELKEACGVW
jgi:hypothetical protein